MVLDYTVDGRNPAPIDRWFIPLISVVFTIGGAVHLSTQDFTLQFTGSIWGPSRRKKCSRPFRKWSQSIVENTHFMVVVFYPEFLGGLTVFIIKNISAIYDIYISIYNPHFTPNRPHPLDLQKLMVQKCSESNFLNPISPSIPKSPFLWLCLPSPNDMFMEFMALSLPHLAFASVKIRWPRLLTSRLIGETVPGAGKMNGTSCSERKASLVTRISHFVDCDNPQ